MIGLEPALGTWLAHLSGRAAGLAAAPTPREWIQLAELAELHNLRPLTYRRLTDGPFGSQMPDLVGERLRPAYLDAAVRNALILRHTGRAIAALAEAGIEVIPLKGLHLCRFVYPEPALRGMADVDLLLRRDRLADAERIFLARGFGPLPRAEIDERCGWSNHLAKLTKEGEPVFELHWHIERPTSPFQIDLDGLWSRARPAELEGTPVRTLAFEDLLHHVALHGAYHHRFDRSAFKMLVDFHALVSAAGPRLDWSALVERANAWGTSGYLYAALRVGRTVVNLEVPPEVFDQLSHGSEDDEVAGLARGYVLGLGVEVPNVYLELARISGWRARAKHILRHTFPPRPAMEKIEGVAPDAWLLPRYLKRLGYLAVRRSGLLLRALIGPRVRRTAFDRQAARRRFDGWAGYQTEGSEGD